MSGLVGALLVWASGAILGAAAWAWWLASPPRPPRPPRRWLCEVCGEEFDGDPAAHFRVHGSQRRHPSRRTVILDPVEESEWYRLEQHLREDR